MNATDPDLRSEELRKSRAELREAGQRAEELTVGVAPSQLWWRPEPEAWSIGECLDHLVQTGEAYLDVLDEAIENARRRGLRAEGDYRPNLVGRWLPGLLEPPPGLKVPAPGRIRPRSPDSDAPHPGGDPVEAFLELRERFDRRLEAADGLDLGHIGVPSPFVPLLRFDLGSAFRVIAAHERRHLWQARQVREAKGFPG